MIAIDCLIAESYYFLQDAECQNIDECLELVNPCGNNTLCNDTEGSFVCDCAGPG